MAGEDTKEAAQPDGVHGQPSSRGDDLPMTQRKLSVVVDPSQYIDKVEISGSRVRNGIVISLHGLTLEMDAPRSILSCWTCMGKKSPNSARLLLKNITGVIWPGEMYALLGPSGAGKTSLLDVISGRKTMGNISGKVLLDGKKPTSLRLKRDTAYVQQHDALLCSFTVYECILFTAMLRLPRIMNYFDKRARAIEVIDKMGLFKAMNTRIGSPLSRGISGGELKRVSIALGLLNDPQCLFLDEPTSGLDSAIALDVMSAVKFLSDEGRTVLCTIHQPSAAIFDLFGCVILLRAGNVVYFGEGRNEVRDYFVEMGYPYEGYDNVSEYLLETVGGGVLAAYTPRVAKGSDYNSFVVNYKNSEVHSRNLLHANNILNSTNDSSCRSLQNPNAKESPERLDSMLSNRSDMSDISNLSESAYSNPLLNEIGIMVAYRGFASWKDPQFIGTRLGLALIFALIMASFWSNVTTDSHGLMSLSSLLFMAVGAAVFTTSVYVPTLVEERPVFVRERHDACYRVISYALHKIIIEGTAGVVAVIIFSPIVYWACGLRESAYSYIFFNLTLWTLNFAAVMLTLSVASASPNVEIAGAAVPLVMTLNFFVGGFMVLADKIPVWWNWLYRISYVQWGFSALMVNQFSGEEYVQCYPLHNNSSQVTMMDVFSRGLGNGLITGQDLMDATCSTGHDIDTNSLTRCSALQFAQYDNACLGPVGLSLMNENRCGELCVAVRGDNVLDMFGLGGRDKWQSLGFVAANLPVFCLFFYLALRFIKHESR
eukprot:CAMPEP_0198238714 /NCGR_PEP_ID=MMETSP1446-20131203/4304_1 /TAXON_ID=1461542 ORGANISM="Unidentified sp, Strain CCMP2111" /NCGR_SAMPLE_ID=MMETSP1446 /ASSEMBLY_ACC=CAM_ASM_001112 /LENGTH=768 /DNA_ID=CAMNT_0043921181 /DNA_START=419 /DNA_END=2725 /DNA_ORIENTATION=+